MFSLIKTQQADCVNLLVKYYKEARHGVYLSNDEGEARMKRDDHRAPSQDSEKSLTVKTGDVKSKTRGPARCCICFDPFSIQTSSVVVFFCCHAYHEICLLDSMYTVNGKEGSKTASFQRTASDYGYDDGDDEEEEDEAESGSSRMRCILCTTAAS